jgi:hypothetical protein
VVMSLEMMMHVYSVRMYSICLGNALSVALFVSAEFKAVIGVKPDL